MQYFPDTQVMIPCCDILNIAVAYCDTLWFISFLQLQNCVKEKVVINCFIKNDKVLEKIHFFLFHEAFKKTTFSLNSESRLKIPHDNINNTHASDFIYLPENTEKKLHYWKSFKQIHSGKHDLSLNSHSNCTTAAYVTV